MKIQSSPRIEPLPPEHTPELADAFEGMRKNLGFIPNSMLILQRKPKIARALQALTAAIWDPAGEVERGFKRLIAHVASRTAGQACRGLGVPHELVVHGSRARGARLRHRRCVGAERRHRRDVRRAAQPLERRSDRRDRRGDRGFGFLNRWNDTIGTPLEEEPLSVGAKFLAPHGWSPGKHAR